MATHLAVLYILLLAFYSLANFTFAAHVLSDKPARLARWLFIATAVVAVLVWLLICFRLWVLWFGVLEAAS